MKLTALVILIGTLLSGCVKRTPSTDERVADIDSAGFPIELTHFSAYKKNPVFTGTNSDTWDQRIRERGWIIFCNKS